MTDESLKAEIEALQSQVGALERRLIARAGSADGEIASARESEARFRRLMDALPVAIAYLDSDMRVGYANKRAADHHDLRAQEILGMHIRDVRGEENFARSQPYYDMAMAGREVVYEGYSIRGDGSRFDFQSTYLPHFGADQQVLGLFVLVTDITARKQTEAAFKESEERYRRVIEASPDAILVHQKGSIVFGNRAAVQLHGAKNARQLIGYPVLDLLESESRKLVAERQQAVYDRKQQQEFAELRGMRLDGGEFIVEATATPFIWNGEDAVLVVSRDIRARKQAERELVTAQMRLREAIESMPDGFVLWDADDRMVMCNSKFREFFPEIVPLLVPGVSFESVVRAVSDCGIILGREGREEEAFRERLERHRNPGKPFDQKQANGRWVRINERRPEDGGVVSTRSDITELKQREGEARTAQDAAEMANRAKSEFLANMSHELRTPLNAILGFSEVIRNEMLGAIDNDHYREYVGDIHNSGQHLLSIINDILDLSKIEAGHVELDEEVFDATVAVDSSVRLVKERADTSGVRMTVDVAGEHPRLRGDHRKFKQIIINLLSNAVKFTPADGTVTISVGMGGDGGFNIAVSDTGIGMDADQIEIALSPFGQIEGGLNRKHEGTGLGLPLARSLAELHDGRIEIESAPGAGTTVTVCFPPARLVA